jgi:hypothetical protein
MKVGTIIYATNSGLGILAKDFYDNGVITDVLVQSHPDYKNNYFWYNDTQVLPCVTDIANSKGSTPKYVKDVIEKFIDSVDILLIFEIEWYSEIVQAARSKGKKVILMPMYECTPFPIHADCYLTVSDLDHKYYTHMYNGRDIRRINIPVNSAIKWKQRTRAHSFIHNAGNARAGDRNGTEAILASIPYIQSKDIDIRIRSQHTGYTQINDSRVKFEYSNKNFSELWSEGDVFLFPESWNGLSLPIQEAFSSGMAVMCGNRFPMNNWLPTAPMIDPIGYYQRTIVPNVPFSCAQYSPISIAKKIDELANTDISEYSNLGQQWANDNSWNKLKLQYVKIIKDVYEN